MSSPTDSIKELFAKLQSIGKKGGGGESESAPQGGGKLDPKAVLAWVKSHPAKVSSQ